MSTVVAPRSDARRIRPRLDNTIIVAAAADEAAPDQVHRAVRGLREWASHFLYEGKHAAVRVRRTLTKHAYAYRQDVAAIASAARTRRPTRADGPFYLHSRPASRRPRSSSNDELGGGSLTALPVNRDGRRGDVSA